MTSNLPIDQITFCIKTIHRPWACHRLVESLRKEFVSPTIVVVDDGRPELRFSSKYPETAKHCRVIDLDTHDVGVGIGRNTAIDAAETELVFLLDDDQIVTADLHLDRVYERFMEHKLDILAVRQGGGGQPMMLSPLMNGKRIWMHRGEYKRVGPVCWCDMVSNAFLARRDTIARVRWDESIKTYEHWEFFYRASRIEKLAIAVAVDCSVVHAHVGAKPYGDLRGRPKFRAMGLRKHGFHSMRYPGGGIVNDHPGGRLLRLIHLESRFSMYLSRVRFGGLPILLGHRYPNLRSRSYILRRFTLGRGCHRITLIICRPVTRIRITYRLAIRGAMFLYHLDGLVVKFVPKTS